MKNSFSYVVVALSALFSFLPSMVFAKGYADPWQLGFQEAASPVMERMIEFHDLLLYVIVGITLFVTALLLYVCVRFRAKRNPNPSKTTHHVLLEIVWTVVPVIILVAICVPSMRLLYYAHSIEDADMTLKVVGHQWYWSYQYPDQGNFSFESRMIPDEELKPGQLRLLEVDERVVLPVDTNIRLLMTGADVIHNWAVPALALKMDAVPGRSNEQWVRITKPGVYYGQCSELCGTLHGFMPIAIEAVSKEEFEAWAEAKKAELASLESNETIVIAQQ